MMRNFYCRLWLAGLIVSALQTQAMGIDMSVYGPDTVVNKQSDKLFAKGMLSPFCREGIIGGFRIRCWIATGCWCAVLKLLLRATVAVMTGMQVIR